MFSSQNLALDRLTGFYMHSSSLAREQGKKKKPEKLTGSSSNVQLFMKMESSSQKCIFLQGR
jgi:hypothetical protein